MTWGSYEDSRLKAATDRAAEVQRRYQLRDYPEHTTDAMVDFAAGELDARRAELEDAMRRHRKNVEAELRWQKRLCEELRAKILEQRDWVSLLKRHGAALRQLRADVDRLRAARWSWLTSIIGRKK